MQLFKLGLLKKYINATNNEIAIDAFFSKNKKMPSLPRVSIWMKKTKNSFMLFFLYWILMITFIFGGFFIYIFLTIFKDFIGYVRNKSSDTTVDPNSIKEYYLALSELGFNQVKSLNHGHLNDICILTVPWVSLKECASVNKFSVFKMLTFIDYVNLFILLIVTYFYFIFSPTKFKWLLQIYSAPRWYLTALSIDKLSGKFITSEHYDRWAVLIDSICFKNGNTLTLVQHGSLKGLLTPSYQYFGVSYKLCSVSDIYVYDDVELSLFLDNFICNKAIKPNVHYMELSLELQPIPSGDFSILIVGHILCENDQLRLAELIYNSVPNCTIYYKEHPKAQATKAARQANWIFIEDDDYFPDVNVVISYPSTLAYHYQEYNKHILMHDLNKIDLSEQSTLITLINKLSKEYGV